MLSTPPAFILSQDQTLMLKVYPVQKFLATVFKVAFYKSCSFIFMMTWIFSFAILPVLGRNEVCFQANLFALESFKVIHCSVVNVLCFFSSSLSQQQLLYLIKNFRFCQELFSFLFCCSFEQASLISISALDLFVKNFFIFFLSRAEKEGFEPSRRC